MIRRLAFLLLLGGLPCVAHGQQPAAGLPPYAGPPYSCVQAFGDSITDGVGSSTLRNGGSGATGYAWQIINAYGGCGTNYGFGGDQAGDMAIKVMSSAAPKTQSNPLTTMMISTNDYGNYGTTTALQTVFQAALENSIAWAAIPDVAKLNFYNNTAACTFTGSGWGAVAATASGYPAYEGDTTNGDYVTCTFTMYETGPIYVSYTVFQTGTIAATQGLSVSVDGGSATSFSEVPTTSTITTYNGNTYFPILGRLAGPYTGSASGTTHTVKITNTGPTGGSPAGYLSIYWIGAPYPTSTQANTPPRVYVGGTPWENSNTNSTLVSAYNTLIQSVVSLLAGDGLPAYFVNVEANLNTSTDFAGGTLANGYTCPASNNLPLHPGDCGHAHLAQSFLNVLPSAFHDGPLPGNQQIYYGPARSLAGGQGWVYGAVNTWQIGSQLLPPIPAAIALTSATSITSTSYTSTGLVLPTAPPSATYQGHCSIVYEQTTALSTVTFGAGMNNAPTGLWIMNSLHTGTGGATSADVYTTITSTTTTAISGTTAPAATATGYKNEIDFVLQTGTSNPVTLTIYGKSGNASDAMVIEPGSYCTWLP